MKHTHSRSHAQNHAENCPEVLAKWARISRVLPQREPFMLFSGLVPWRRHMTSATQLSECWDYSHVPQCLANYVISILISPFFYKTTVNPCLVIYISAIIGHLIPAWTLDRLKVGRYHWYLRKTWTRLMMEVSVEGLYNKILNIMASRWIVDIPMA